MEFKHYSVMLNECMDGLAIKPNGIYVDGTMGGAGHSKEIAKRISKEGLLIGIDRDQEAICVAKERLAEFPNVKFVHDNHDNIKEILDELDISGVDGILLDLGVSSYQLDERNRGFSYMGEAELDMRMDRTQSLTAKTVVNKYSEEELAKIIFEYGEEKFSRPIARKIVEKRKEKEIETTQELVDIIEEILPRRKGEGQPAKRTFQAIRIEVNGELTVLKKVLPDAIELLNETGRMSVITFHSLEDRIVKQTYKSLTTGCTCPKDFPVCVCGQKPKIKELTKKPILPSDEELEINLRAHSAKLRVAEKI